MNPDINTRTEGFIDDAHGEDAEIIDEEELNKLKELKELKRQYRDAFTILKSKKNEATYTQQAIDNAKQQLVEGFEAWYDETFESADQQNTTSALGTTKTATARETMNEDELEEEEDQEREGIDKDKDALQYI